MILVDHDIAALGENLIEGFSPNSITNIGYDLTAKVFWVADKPLTQATLLPGESAFIQAKENIHLPNNMIARVTLRNSRIRQGYSLDAPVYQPGHHTSVFCRITNVSSETLVLQAGQRYAMVMFETLDSVPDNPYAGAFSNEHDFIGLSSYTKQYRKEIKRHYPGRKVVLFLTLINTALCVWLLLSFCIKL